MEDTQNLPILPIKEEINFCALAIHYKKMKKYDLMKKYFILAHKNGDRHAISLLGHYYQTINA